MTIDIKQGGVPVGGYPKTVGLTPTSTGCTSTLVDTLCQLSLPLAPGSYTATISLLDASGNALSGAQSVPFTVVAGETNSIPIVLGGVPHAILVSTESPTTSQIQNASQIAFTGASSVKLSVVATDADGNLILGPGAPTITASISGASGGSGISVISPSNTSPNTLSLSATGFGSATLTLLAIPNGGGAFNEQLSVLAGDFVATIAGSATSGFTDGTGTAARLHNPRGITYDSNNGNIYVADFTNCAIRSSTTGGIISTIAGPNPALCGYGNGTGSAAYFDYPVGIAFDPANLNFYVTDNSNCGAIRQVTAGGAVATIAGAAGGCGLTDGSGSAATFYYPNGIAYDPANGDLYVADTNNCAIRQVTTSGVVTTIAGANPASCGFADGTGTSARFSYPKGITYDAANGVLYVADTNNCAIRQVTTAGVVTTIAGANPANCGFADGNGNSPQFNLPADIAYDSGNGDLYVADTSNCAIRQVTTTGVVTTISGAPNNCGFAMGFDKSLANPVGITYDATNGLLYITDLNAVQSIQF